MGMEFSETEKIVGRDLRCSKCNRTVARVIDETYMKVGDLLFYESCRFSCVHCGRNLNFRVREFSGSGFGEPATKEILNNLGSPKKFTTQRKKKG